MTHITSIGAGIYSDLSVCVDVGANSTVEDVIAVPNEANFKLCFGSEIANGTTPGVAGSGEFIRIQNVREFPSMGTPPNIVNVPVYGSATSQQIQGQSDAPSMEVQLNLVGTDWQKTADYLGNFVGDSVQRAFRFSLLNTEPAAYASLVGELGGVENSQYFWIGKIEALQVNPQLTDANTATVTLTIQSDFYGAFTD